MGNRWVSTEDIRRQLRAHVEAGTPQKHLAKLIGVSEPFLSRVLSRKAPPGPTVAKWVLSANKIESRVTVVYRAVA